MMKLLVEVLKSSHLDKKTNALLDRAFVVKRRHERKMTGFFTSGGVKKGKCHGTRKIDHSSTT